MKKLLWPCDPMKYRDGCQCAKCFPLAIQEAESQQARLGPELAEMIMTDAYNLMQEQIRRIENGERECEHTHGEHPPFGPGWLKRSLRILSMILEKPLPKEAGPAPKQITAEEARNMTDDEFLKLCGIDPNEGKDEEKAA